MGFAGVLVGLMLLGKCGLRVCVYLMSYSSQYIQNIRIMADSVVLSIEIPMMIPMERTTLSAMIRTVHFPYTDWSRT